MSQPRHAIKPLAERGMVQWLACQLGIDHLPLTALQVEMGIDDIAHVKATVLVMPADWQRLLAEWRAQHDETPR